MLKKIPICWNRGTLKRSQHSRRTEVEDEQYARNGSKRPGCRTACMLALYSTQKDSGRRNYREYMPNI